MTFAPMTQILNNAAIVRERTLDALWRMVLLVQGGKVDAQQLFAAASAQNVQSQTDQQSHINAEHFSLTASGRSLPQCQAANLK